MPRRSNGLKADGRLYPCYETAEELALKRRSRLAAGKPPVYDRAALDLAGADRARLEAQGRRPHWRFKLAPDPIGWEDRVRGPVAFDPASLSDPVVIREDGRPLYHLCSVVDDIDLGITEVVRGEDHVANTATHVQMAQALDAAPPRFAHLPLLADAEGKPLSKRLGSLSLEGLREAGIEPLALVGPAGPARHGRSRGAGDVVRPAGRGLRLRPVFPRHAEIRPGGAGPAERPGDPGAAVRRGRRPGCERWV